MKLPHVPVTNPLSLPFTTCLQVHKHDFFFDFFCRNRNLMVPRACNTRFLKIVFDSRYLTFKNIRACSACDEIGSPYAQCAIKFVLRMLIMDCTCNNVHILPLAEHARKFVPRTLVCREGFLFLPCNN